MRSDWRPALLWLAALGVFFYLSYGFANWAASQRETVPSIVFDWEKRIPFLAWTILPYWTTNLFYAFSLLLSRTRLELQTQAYRLLTAQIVAVACFLLLPLKISWIKPEAGGLFGDLYAALGAFDKPYNQAPSLHVALTVVLTAFYLRISSRFVGALLIAWAGLVILSVLTTWQHHFIDVPTGFLLGLFCLWLWPFDAPMRFAHWRRSDSSRALRLASAYGAGAALCAFLALAFGGAALWLFWPCAALALVSIAYAGLGPAAFAKSANGRMDWAARLWLAPYMLGAWANARLWTRGAAPFVEIEDGVFLGRFPSAREAARFSTVIDLTAEFSRPSGDACWRAFPSLDLIAPSSAVLTQAAGAIDDARAQGEVLVCCALGYGRSAAALAVWLTRTGRTRDFNEAFARIAQRRPKIALNADQILAIREAADETLH